MDKSRLKLSLLLIFLSFAVSAILGLVFSCIPMGGTWVNRFLIISKYLYFLFTASATVSGVLGIITNIPDDQLYGYGLGIYYGGLIIASIMQNVMEWNLSDEQTVIISGLISCLCAYIFWLRHKKTD